MQLPTLEFRDMGDLAYSAIRDAIVTAQFAPGSKLSQDELARQLGVSRAPVRDALNRLEAEGFVRTAAKGMVVAELTAEELADIFEVRALIDSFATRKACERLGEVELCKLEEIVEKTAQLTDGGDIYELVQAHGDFHEVIYASCGNAELMKIARSIWDRSYRYRVTGLLDEVTALSSLEEHRAILQAIRLRDAKRAQELMAEHNHGTASRVVQQVRATAS